MVTFLPPSSGQRWDIGSGVGSAVSELLAAAAEDDEEVDKNGV